MMNYNSSVENINEIPTLNLAFIGDGVYDLLVREYLVSHSNLHVGELNRQKVELVNCKSQAQFIRQLQYTLTEEELSVYKRGRNTQTGSVSKHSTIADYHAATGLETLFGWLYLKGEKDRINELFGQIMILSDQTEG
ncbi:MAG: ribonuclease III [Ruminococcus sp.]|nr:ribonuclease III [Ruminococcus sp.]